MCYGNVLEQGLRTARKEHICLWCGEKIEPRTKYFIIVIKDDKFYRQKYHKECDDAVNEHGVYDWDDCISLEGNQPRGGYDENLL